MRRDAIILVRSIYRANRSFTGTPRYYGSDIMRLESKLVLSFIPSAGRHWLEEFLDNFEVLKLEIRLCVDMRLKRYLACTALDMPEFCNNALT